MAPPLSMASYLLRKRACDDFDDDDCDYDDDDFWWSSTGYGVRYAIIAIIFVCLCLILFAAYFHAQRRIRKGLPPLAYHRWLVARRQYAPYPQNRYAYYQQDPAYPPQQGHPMHNMGPGGAYHAGEFQPPPPAYGNWEPPPVYQPPQGASKVAANQNVQGVGAREEGAGEGSSASLPLNHAQNNNRT